MEPWLVVDISVSVLLADSMMLDNKQKVTLHLKVGLCWMWSAYSSQHERHKAPELVLPRQALHQIETHPTLALAYEEFLEKANHRRWNKVLHGLESAYFDGLILESILQICNPIQAQHFFCLKLVLATLPTYIITIRSTRYLSLIERLPETRKCWRSWVRIPMLYSDYWASVPQVCSHLP